MRKILIIIPLLCIGWGAWAQTYKHSVGIDVGTLYGFSYKGFVFPSVPELALQLDAGINVFATAGTYRYRYTDTNLNLKTDWVNQSFGRMQVYDLVVQPDIVYQKVWDTRDWGTISWMAGGGISIGYMRQNSKAYDYATGQYDFIPLMTGKAMRGKFGVNVLTGIELAFKEAPLALSFDFRPGYGLGWAWETDQEHHEKIDVQLHYLDWTMAIGLRYCLKEKKAKNINQ